MESQTRATVDGYLGARTALTTSFTAAGLTTVAGMGDCLTSAALAGSPTLILGFLQITFTLPMHKAQSSAHLGCWRCGEDQVCLDSKRFHHQCTSRWQHHQCQDWVTALMEQDSDAAITSTRSPTCRWTPSRSRPCCNHHGHRK